MSGFVTMHREAFLHPVLKDAERFRAWFWLVAHAAWKPTKHDARGHTITVERGQICAGREYLAKQWGWSPSTVERFLTRLETEHMIERMSGQIKTVIIICNYDKYQSDAEDGGHMSGQKTGQKPDRNRTAKEEGKQGNKIEPNGSIDRDSAGARDFPKPDWAQSEVWRDFLKNRRTKRLPNTPTAYQGFLADIAKLSDDDWPPGRLLEHATAKGWGAIYEPDERKGGNNGTASRAGGSANGPDRRSSRARAIDAAFESLGSGP